jgi:predicted TIM-barrel fold metal-dependent hydrolase
VVATPKIIDAQVHTWTPRNDEHYPWNPQHEPHGFFDTQLSPDPVEKVVADMDSAGVDAALLVVPTLYGFDNSYAIDSARRFADRLAVVARIDWKAPDPVSRLGELMAEPTVAGIRLSKRSDAEAWGREGEFEPMLAAAEELGVPVCGITGTDCLFAWAGVAERHPELRLIVDHLGLEAPPTTRPDPGPEPFKLLENLLDLASHPNIYVKLTATAALSNEPFPFPDIWAPVRRIVEVFGSNRVMWGSDYNRTQTLHSYPEAVEYLSLIEAFDAATRQALYASTLSNVYGWSPEGVATGQADSHVREETR